MSNKHIPVLANKVVEAFEVESNQWYLDATFGRGGHTRLLLEEGAKVVAFDWDQEAIDYGREAFAESLENNSLILVRESFAKIGAIIADLQTKETVGDIVGVLFDFGTSLEQLTSSERGFSFAGQGPLDMRMDDRLGVTAADILLAVPMGQLADLFYHYGGEKQSKKIAKAIKDSPEPITTTQQLSDLVTEVKGGRHGKLHPATKVFQALRIAVNSELTEIEQALPQALELLKPTGKLITLAFHEGEDRIAKTYFNEWDRLGLGTAQDLITPSDEEQAQNPRSSSAKMRVFKKTTKKEYQQQKEKIETTNKNE